VERWHLPSVEASGKRDPRVLFSRPEARAVLIDLRAGDELGDHRLHENAVVYVVSGSIALDADGRTVQCEAGTLLTFSSGENRRLRAANDSRILLLLSPWPGEGHYRRDEAVDPRRVPANAAEPPLSK
jgi:quercetin dioxygenase-like cupin family protein